MIQKAQAMNDAEATARPWQVTTDKSGTIIRVLGGTKKPIASMWLNGDDAKATAALIVSAVNERDQLLSDKAALEAEVARLREALQTIDDLLVHGMDKVYSQLER